MEMLIDETVDCEWLPFCNVTRDRADVNAAPHASSTGFAGSQTLQPPLHTLQQVFSGEIRDQIIGKLRILD